MDANDVANTRLFSANGTVRLLENDASNPTEINFMGVANFNAPEAEEHWYITKFTWAVVGSSRCIIRIEDSGTRHKWTDRANAGIMGWR